MKCQKELQLLVVEYDTVRRCAQMQSSFSYLPMQSSNPIMVS